MTPYWIRNPQAKRIDVPWADHVLRNVEARTAAAPVKQAVLTTDALHRLAAVVHALAVQS